MNSLASLEQLLADIDAALDELLTSRRPADAGRAGVTLLEVQIELETLVNRRRAFESARDLTGATAPAPIHETLAATLAELARRARLALRRCSVCGFPLAGLRDDARYCGATCRKRAWRRAHPKGDPDAPPPLR